MNGQVVPQYSGADGNGDGLVDDADYDVWRANFGNTLDSGQGASIANETATLEGGALALPLSNGDDLRFAAASELRSTKTISDPQSARRATALRYNDSTTASDHALLHLLADRAFEATARVSSSNTLDDSSEFDEMLDYFTAIDDFFAALDDVESLAVF